MEAHIGREAQKLLEQEEKWSLLGTVHVNHRVGKAGGGGELYFSKDHIRYMTCEDGNCKNELGVAELNKKLEGSLFSQAFLNPQGQLCLDLNRPIVFLRTLSQVADEKNRYGSSRPNRQGRLISIVYCPCAMRGAGGYGKMSSVLGQAGSGCSIQCHQCGAPSIEEARVYVLAETMANVLHVCGYDVHQSRPCLMFESHRGKAAHPSLSSRHDEESRSDNSKDCPSVSVPDFISSLATPPYLIPPAKGRARGQWLDARQFLMDHKLLRGDYASGKGSQYDRNIEHIQITDADKCPTMAACVSCGNIARLEQCQELGAGQHRCQVTCHVTPSGKTFLVQQSLVLETMYEVANGRDISVHSVVACGGVDYITGGRGGNGCGRTKSEPRPSFPDLLKIRTDQVSSLYAVRYPELFEGEQLQVASSKIAQAVVRFELLSTDLSKMVKMELPGDRLNKDGIAADIPTTKAPNLPGVFVLYNYARISCVLRKHQQLVGQGLYPPLPPVQEVDFSLLTSEVEWQLLFHFVLHFPTVVAEAVKIRTEDDLSSREGVNPLIKVDVSVNKICLFLVNLAHRFSSYYSQTKFLVSPEPHLTTLINARLHLVSAIKQVMLNALLLLDITPLDEL